MAAGAVDISWQSAFANERTATYPIVVSTNPHDALFKFTFSQVEHVIGELRTILPAGLVRRIDLGSLERVPETFVDEWLVGRRSDVLFYARIGGRPGFLYLLVEHQSTVDPLMAYRVIRYMVRIWERWLESNPDAKTLPVIVPVVVHHSDTGWSAAVALEELLDADRSTRDELGAALPRLTFLLDDLTTQSDDALHARAMTAFARSRSGRSAMRANPASSNASCRVGASSCAACPARTTVSLRWPY